MSNHAPLTFVDHQNVRVLTDRSSQLGDAVMTGHTFPWEYEELLSDYAILFSKNPDRESYSTVALFGFEQGENLFLADDQWQANYIPAAIRMPPFLMGYASKEELESNNATQVHINLDHPRISGTAGEKLFNEDGSNTDFMQQQVELLGAVKRGLHMTEEFCGLLEKLELLEPLSVDIELADGSKNRLAGFHIIDEDKLQALRGADLEMLHEKGYLKSIYMMIASLANMPNLIAKKMQASQPVG